MSIDLERLRLTKDKDLLKEFSGYTRERLRELKKELPTRIPKILVFDIETAPLEVWTWGLYNQNIGINQIKNDWFTLNWAAKWLFDDVMMTGVLTKKELLEKDDKRIVKKAWDLFNQAEIVLAHNGDKFDIAKINSRFLKHDLKLPSPYQSIDTLKIARQAFRLTSNKLDYICKYLGLKGKIQTGGFELWKNCINGDMKSLKKMNEYCQNDVIILEEMYLKLRPYAKGHPNLALYMESDYEVCPNCGSDKLKWGYLYYTKVNTYECARCENCGAYMRVRKNNTKNKDLLLTN